MPNSTVQGLPLITKAALSTTAIVHVVNYTDPSTPVDRKITVADLAAAYVIPFGSASSSTDPSGVPGELRLNDGYLYIKKYSGSWRRLTLGSSF